MRNLSRVAEDYKAELIFRRNVDVVYRPLYAREQAGFKVHGSHTESLFNSKNIVAKSSDHSILAEIPNAETPDSGIAIKMRCTGMMALQAFAQLKLIPLNLSDNKQSRYPVQLTDIL